MPKKFHSTKRINTIKLTAQNLTTHTAAQHTISANPIALTDSHFRPNPPTCATKYQIRRKPLADAARERIQELKNEGVEIAPLAQVADERPLLIQTITNFGQFVRVRRGGSWQRVDDKERRKESNSVSVVAADGIAKVG